MSNIVLSASVRQNLLSLQSTASLLATTQNDLATGNKVNSALDNPTNFFTAQNLNTRASDISNLLDSIGNGVQVLQAANTGITSLQSLLSSAQSIANQALQTSSGYDTKSNVSTTIGGATTDNLLGTTTYTNASANSNVLFDGTTGGTTAVSATTLLGSQAAATIVATSAVTSTPGVTTTNAAALLDSTNSDSAATSTTLLANLDKSAGTPSALAAGDTLTFDGKTITFSSTAANSISASGTTATLNLSTATLGDLVNTVNQLEGSPNALKLNATGTLSFTNPAAITFAGTAQAKLDFGAGATTAGTSGNITSTTHLFDSASGGLLGSAIADGTTMTVNGHSITFKAEDAPTVGGLPQGSSFVGSNGLVTDGNGNSTIYMGTFSKGTNATVGDLTNAIDLASGAQYVKSANSTTGVATLGGTASSIGAGILTLTSSTGGDLSITGQADLLSALSLTSAVGPGNTTISAYRATAANSVSNFIQDGSTLNVDGKTITFKNSGTPAAANVAAGSGVSGNVVTDGSGNSTVYLQTGTVQDVLTAIDLATGAQTASNTSGSATLSVTNGAAKSSVDATGALQISTGLTSDLSISGTGNALKALGLNGATGTATSFTAARTAVAGDLSGKELTFSSFNGGTAVDVTFGDGTNGTVKTLDQLNTALQADNMSAAIDPSGNLTISASNDYASSTLGSTLSGGVMGGSAASALTWSAPTAPVADSTSQATRASLVGQYNNIMQQIQTTAQDASFNGVNLLNGDQLKMVFNETGSSTLNIQGVTDNPTGLGLSNLTSGTDFLDNAGTNKILNVLKTAQSTLQSQASTLGSNLSIVQIRQDFSQNMINVLQTGASNLTLADPNTLAADSQALSTRQSIAVSALALANSSQQSVLRLLQ